MRRVLHLKMVTQCAMLEDFGIFLVLADKVCVSLIVINNFVQSFCFSHCGHIILKLWFLPPQREQTCHEHLKN